MTIDELIEKCNQVNFQRLYMTDELCIAITDKRIGDGDYIYGNINERVYLKELYSKTTDFGKYGSRVCMLYLDDEPIGIISSSGRYFNSHSFYHLSEDKLQKIREWLESNYRPHNDVESAPMLLTEELLNNPDWFKSKLVDVALPFVQDD